MNEWTGIPDLPAARAYLDEMETYDADLGFIDAALEEIERLRNTTPTLTAELTARATEAAGTAGLNWIITQTLEDALDNGFRHTPRQPTRTPPPPEHVWYGLAACGCPVAWTLNHPSTMTPEELSALNKLGPLPVFQWVLCATVLDNRRTTWIKHPIIKGDSLRDGPIFVKEPDRINWSLDACQRTEQLDALDQWTPP